MYNIIFIINKIKPNEARSYTRILYYLGTPTAPVFRRTPRLPIFHRLSIYAYDATVIIILRGRLILSLFYRPVSAVDESSSEMVGLIKGWRCKLLALWFWLLFLFFPRAWKHCLSSFCWWITMLLFHWLIPISVQKCIFLIICVDISKINNNFIIIKCNTDANDDLPMSLYKCVNSTYSAGPTLYRS